MPSDLDLAAVLRAAVGRVDIRQVELFVRRTMVLEALRRSGGNRRAAARLLGISRQHLQHMLRAMDPRMTGDGAAGSHESHARAANGTDA